MIVDIFTLVLVGKLIEPLWGALEMLTFFLIVNTGVAVSSAFFYYLLYMCTFNTELLFDVHIHGLSGYLAGVSIAVKQVMPDHVLAKTPLGKITNRNIPLSVFGLTFIMWAIGMVEGSYCTMFGCGLIISWIYLRFYQVQTLFWIIVNIIVKIQVRKISKFSKSTVFQYQSPQFPRTGTGSLESGGLDDY